MRVTLFNGSRLVRAFKEQYAWSGGGEGPREEWGGEGGMGVMFCLQDRSEA